MTRRITQRWVQLAAALVVLLVLGNSTQTCSVLSTDTVCLDPSQEQQQQGQEGNQNPTCNTAGKNDAIPLVPPRPHPRRPECNLYMAESTIPGAGLGLFSAVSWNMGDSLHNEDVAIPLLELSWHHGDVEEGDFFDTTASYIWDGESVGMQWEVKAGSDHGVSGYWPGWGASPNCRFGMENIATSWEGMSYHESHDSSSITTTTTAPHQPRQRVSNPGAGANSYFRGSPVTALRDIPAGSELFLGYGDD
jgi:hypothetical protein